MIYSSNRTDRVNNTAQLRQAVARDNPATSWNDPRPAQPLVFSPSSPLLLLPAGLGEGVVLLHGGREYMVIIWRKVGSVWLTSCRPCS